MDTPKTTTSTHDADSLRATVRASYGQIATAGSSCCAPTCCGAGDSASPSTAWYDADELASLPEGTDLGLGCGNPHAIANLRPDEVVIDLGSGPGLDALIAGRRVGPGGRVIGVDMTPEMLARARRAAAESEMAGWVSFREGIVEALPIADETADVVLSNCVINLSPDKGAAFREAFRVLKPGGRLAVSDILLTDTLPEDVREDVALHVGCIGGASVAEDYLGAVRAAGFEDITWTRDPAAALLAGVLDDPRFEAAADDVDLARLREIGDTVFSYRIAARKP